MIKALDELIEEFPLEPFRDRVFVKPDQLPDERITDGGLVLQTKAGERALTGRIVAVGPQVQEYANWLHLGQRVVYSEFAGYAVKYKGQTYLLCTPDDIFCEVPDHVQLS